jgi:hypothetical protein
LTDQPPPQMTRPLHSTPVPGVSSLLRAGPPAHPAPVLSPSRCRPLGTLPLAPATRADGHIGARLPTFHAEAADQARVAFMPDTTWPVSGHPPGSSRSSEDSPGFDVVSTFSTPQQRSPSWSPPDTSTGAFSTSLTTTVFSQRSMWWFEASPRRAAPKGQTFISHAAPHQEALPTSSSPPRSWHTSSRTCLGDGVGSRPPAGRAGSHTP